MDKKLLNSKQLNINQETAYNKLISCTKVREVRNLDKFLYEIKYKWGNNLKLVLKVQAEDKDVYTDQRD